jgi:hypothetical protein
MSRFDEIARGALTVSSGQDEHFVLFAFAAFGAHFRRAQEKTCQADPVADPKAVGRFSRSSFVAGILS